MATPRTIRPGMLLDPGAPINQGLVGWWPMWEGAGGKTLDISGKNNHGTLTNGPVWSGDGLKFDGTNDYVTMGDVLDFERTAPFSVSAWANLISLSGTPQIIVKNNNASPYQGWSVDINTSQLRFALINTVTTSDLRVQSDTTLVVNRLYHLASTYDGSSNAGGVKLYVDGVATATTIVSDTLATTTLTSMPLQIGARNGANLPTNGQINDVRIFNRALSALEVQQLYVNPNIGLWVPDTKRYYIPAAGGADVRKKIISAYMRIAA